jgi:hypothetical protein
VIPRLDAWVGQHSRKRRSINPDRLLKKSWKKSEFDKTPEFRGKAPANRAARGCQVRRGERESGRASRLPTDDLGSTAEVAQPTRGHIRDWNTGRWHRCKNGDDGAARHIDARRPLRRGEIIHSGQRRQETRATVSRRTVEISQKALEKIVRRSPCAGGGNKLWPARSWDSGS